MDIERLPASQAGIRRAAELVAAGEIVAFPTDTVYGVGCRWEDETALGRIFELKQRPIERRVPVLVASLDDVGPLGLARDDRAERLAAAFWPGPLTIVLPVAGDAETIGVRAPDHTSALGLIGLTGPLRVTSANLSGHSDALSADEVLEAFGGSELLAAVVDGGTTPGGRPSTVLDLSVDPPRVVRIGPISVQQLSGCIGPVAAGG